MSKKDFDRIHKDEKLLKLRNDSVEQMALNRIIRNRTQGEELNGDEFWLIQKMIDKQLWENKELLKWIIMK